MNYGTISAAIWQSPDFGDLTPEEKFFAIYTISAPQAKKCGCWPINHHIAAAETGYNKDTIAKLINRLVEVGWLLEDRTTREILIIDWAKNNRGFFKQSADSKKKNSARLGIEAEAKLIKSDKLRLIVEGWLRDGERPADPPSTPLAPPVDGGSNSTTTITVLDGTNTLTEMQEIVKLFPLKKRTARHMQLLADAINKAGAEEVEENIKRALSDSDRDDPWAFVMRMLSDLISGNDWYYAEKMQKIKSAEVRQAVIKKDQEIIKIDKETNDKWDEFNSLFCALSEDKKQNLIFLAEKELLSLTDFPAEQMILGKIFDMYLDGRPESFEI